MKMEKIVCNCFDVTIGDMAEAIRNGARTFEEIQDATSVSQGCGACEEYARNVAEELLEELSKEEE